MSGKTQTYRCQEPWPNITDLILRPYTSPKGGLAVVLEEGTSKPGDLVEFQISIEMPDNVPCRDRYIPGKGACRPSTSYRGVASNPSSAEGKAWKDYKRQLACSHEFHRQTMSDEKRTHIISGHAMCKHCNFYVHDYFMDPVVHKARNWAGALYEGMEWVGTGMNLYMHAQGVFGKVEWNTPFRSNRLAAAAWLCHLNRVAAPPYPVLVEDLGSDVVKLADSVFDPETDEAKYLRLCYHAVDVTTCDKCENPTVLNRKADDADQAVELYGGVDKALAGYITGWAKALRRRRVEKAVS